VSITRSILRDFLEKHKRQQTRLILRSSDMDYSLYGRIADYDGSYVLLRDEDRETEEPYEFVVRIENIFAIHPYVKQLKRDERFRNIMKLYTEETEE